MYTLYTVHTVTVGEVYEVLKYVSEDEGVCRGVEDELNSSMKGLDRTVIL